MHLLPLSEKGELSETPPSSPGAVVLTHPFLFYSLHCLPYISAWIQACKWTSLDCTCFHLNKPHAWFNVITSFSGEPYGWWTVNTLTPSATTGSKSSPVAGSPCAHYTLQCPHTQLMTGSLGKKKKKEQKPQGLICPTLTQSTNHSPNYLYLTLTGFLEAQKRWDSVNPLINILYTVSSTSTF